MKKIKRFLRNLLHDFIIIMVPQFLRKNMLSCEQASNMLQTTPNLSKIKSLKLKMHLLVCQCCTDSIEQIHVIQINSKKLDSINLSDAQRERIKNAKSKVLSSLTKDDE